MYTTSIVTVITLILPIVTHCFNHRHGHDKNHVNHTDDEDLFLQRKKLVTMAYDTSASTGGSTQGGLAAATNAPAAGATQSVSTAVPYPYTTPNYDIIGGNRPNPNPKQPGPDVIMKPQGQGQGSGQWYQGPGPQGSGQPGYGYPGPNQCTNRAALINDMSRIESLMDDMAKGRNSVDDKEEKMYNSFMKVAHLYTEAVNSVTSARI